MSASLSGNSSADLDPNFSLVREPWRHQLEALRLAADKRDFALFFEVGTGKTLTAIMIARYWMHRRGRALRTLVFGPPIIIEKWRDEWLAASRISRSDIYCVYGPGKYRAGIFEDKPLVAITNYESLLMEPVFAAMKKWAPEIIVFDECFHGDTLVETSDGLIKIRDIRVGTRVKNCLGYSYVSDTFRRRVSGSVVVSFGKESITCSLNHLWLTRDGWKKARDLLEGDMLVRTEKALRVVQEETDTDTRGAFLREILLSEMEDASARDSEKNFYSRMGGESFARINWRKAPRPIRITQDQEPDVQERDARESISYSSGKKARAAYSRRQWYRAYQAGATIIKTFTERFFLELGYLYKHIPWKWFTESLQNRHSVPGDWFGNRGRRTIPQRFGEKRTGQKEGSISDFYRVDRVTVYEPGDTREPESDFFYDLTVQGHPSFSVGGVLVHNSHRCKNPSAKRTKKAAELSRLPSAKHRLILTGTPVLQSPMDLYSQFLLLDAGETFGANFYTFRGEYFYDKNAGMPPQKHFPDWQIRKGAEAKITTKISAKSLYVKKEDCLDLPPLVREVIKVALSPEQRRLYDEMAKDLITYVEGKACVAQLAITKLLRLMQIASGFVALEDGGECEIKNNPKLAATSELLEDIAPSSKVIVWAAFRQNYAQLRAVCDKLRLGYVEITGEVSGKAKYEAVDRFEHDDSVRVCIANPGAGGVGVDLISADTSIYVSRTMSLEHDIQSEARNYRGGSERHKKITRYDLVAEGTVDESIAARLANKQAISESILSELVLELKSEIAGGNRRARR